MFSSQVGCRMGCRFLCVYAGWTERNLTRQRFLDQIYAIERDTGEGIQSGCDGNKGKLMDNYDNVVRFIHLLTDEHGKT